MANPKLPALPAATTKVIADAVTEYEKKREDFEADADNLQNRLRANAKLKSLIHSLKWRTKDPTHLADSLERKARKAIEAGESFDTTAENVFTRLPDLAGVRLLHLHMRQMEEIHPLVMGVLEEEGYVVVGRPEAKTWDPEYQVMFEAFTGKLKLKVEQKESFYTSVHYVVRQNSKTRRQLELQVRTLAEEIWGEVSHSINYPHESGSIECKEQLKALARLVSGCSRLVDSIVVSHQECMKREGQLSAPKKTSSGKGARNGRGGGKVV
jgi:putative GTP pyrophosphokinase